MAKTWANSGPDLLVELRGTHRRAGLEDALREAVRSGRLTAGTTLPSSRSLAVDLGISRNTVAAAYAQLIAEGWLDARQGSGTRVSAHSVTPRASTRAEPARRSVSPGARYDLTPGTPDLAGFPRTAWLAAARHALTAVPSSRLGYPDPRGNQGLRATLTQYLGRARGVRTTPTNIIVCSGFLQALHLLASALRRQGGETLAMEFYGLDQHREIVHAAGLATELIGVDELGARVDAIDETAADGVLLTPSHQFPIGVPLAATRRAAVLQWAASRRGLIIEDDYDGEFRYDRKPIGALQGLAPDLVAYVGTASKSLAPGLGLAWLVVPPRLLDVVVETKRLSDGYTGTFEQFTLEAFIASGAYDRHIRRSRLRYRRRLDHLIDAISRRSPHATVTGIAAGLHAVVTVGRGQLASHEAEIVTRASRAGLTIAGLATYTRRPDPQAPAALVVGYGTPPDHAFNGAVDLLCDILG